MDREFVCIVCPRGCQLKVDSAMNVTGNFCPRGKAYAISELTNPTRMVTSSIRVNNRDDLLVSVKTSNAVPKEQINEVMSIINSLSVSAPCHVGQVVKKNILNLNIDIVITKEIE